MDEADCPVAAAYLAVNTELVSHDTGVVPIPVPVQRQRQRYIYDLANPVRAMHYLLEDLAYVREVLKYLESPECRNDMENDHLRIREHIKDHTVIFKGLLATKVRLDTIVIR